MLNIGVEQGIFKRDFFFPWRGIPRRMDSDPIYLGGDFTLTGTVGLFTILPKFEEPYVIETVRARYDDGTGTPVYGTNPKINIKYFSRDPILQGAECIDVNFSPGEGNQFFKSEGLHLQFGGGKQGFEFTVSNFGSYNHLAILFKGRKKYSEIDL